VKVMRLVEAGITTLFFVIFTILFLYGSFDGLENRTLDWRYRARPQQKTSEKIVLVLITDECLTRLGSWPFSRKLYASVIDSLASAGANTIAFDVIFEENSTMDHTGDEEFVASCQRFGRVVLPLVFSEFQLFDERSASPKIIEEVRLPFQTLAEAAAGFGYINADFDYLNPVGVIQKTFLMHQFEGRWLPNYSLAVAEQVSGQKAVIKNEGVTLCGRTIPLIDLPPWKSSKGSWNAGTGKAVYVNFLGTKHNEPFVTYSFADILEKKFKQEDFRDAIVFVGPSAVGLGDLRLTPHGLKPGVIVHANLLENILSANFLEAPLIKWQICIIAIFALLTFAILFWEGAFIASTTLFSIFLTGYVVLCYTVFSRHGLVLPITVPLLMAVIQYVVIRFVQLIANLKLVNANLREQNLKLDQRVQELMVLHTAGSRFPAILETSILAKEVVAEFCELRGADAGLLVFFEAKTGQPQPIGRFAGGRSDLYIQDYRNELTECLKSVFEGKKQLKVHDSPLYSIYLPILVGNSCWGAVCLHEAEGQNKSWQSESFWTTLLGISGTALENARLYEMAREVSLARQIQANFLPQKPLELNGYRVSGKSCPATQLGGDYFDYFIVENRYLVILIADVMGHGVPAALGMTIVKTSVLQRASDDFSVEKLLDTINNTLLNSHERKLMVTAQVTVIDTIQHTSMIYHRGHIFPFRRSIDGKWSQQQCFIAFPLGVKKNSATPGTPVVVNPGERLMFYTDGLYESLEDGAESEMKIAALQTYLEARPHIPIVEACSDILDHHPSFLTGQPQPDDYTVVLLERDSKA